MPEAELLDKTEVWIVDVTLVDADLRELARVAAAILSFRPDRVFVTDVRDRHIVLDVLEPRVELADVAGKEPELLAVLREIDGVVVGPEAAVHSYGVLGVIGTPAEDVPELLARASEVESGLRRYVDRRAVVVSTGGEVVHGNVRDTNFPIAKEILEAAGYEVSFGGTVPDDDATIAGRVARLAGDGHGLVITTGGVGAEDKDRTIEAIQRLDPDLATAVLAVYEVGHGRHVKDSVRVAVATVGWSVVVALPGPSHEVRLALPRVVEGLRGGRLAGSARRAHRGGAALDALLSARRAGPAAP